MGGTEAFPSLGQHCSHEDCHLLDFLPFKCDGCRKVFCGDHRQFEAHSCAYGKARDTLVEICSDCGVSLKFKGLDGAAVLGKHKATCQPRAASERRRAKCPVKGCKEVLTTSNRVKCSDCHQDVCLRHRFASDHNCRAAKAQTRTQGIPNLQNRREASLRRLQDCAKESAGGHSNGERRMEVPPNRDISAH